MASDGGKGGCEGAYSCLAARLRGRHCCGGPQERGERRTARLYTLEPVSRGRELAEKGLIKKPQKPEADSRRPRSRASVRTTLPLRRIPVDASLSRYHSVADEPTVEGRRAGRTVEIEIIMMLTDLLGEGRCAVEWKDSGRRRRRSRPPDRRHNFLDRRPSP